LTLGFDGKASLDNWF